MKKHVSLILLSCLAGTIAGCGDSSVSGDINGRTGTDQARVTLKVTDAPIDNISEVWIQFTAVELMPSGNDAEVIRFDLDSPQTINLLSLTGAKSEILLNNVIIPAGDYEWVRLTVNAAADGIRDSYVRLLDGSEPELSIPTDATVGLKINGGFSADAAAALHMTIDFDLRKSIAITGSGDYVFRPVLKMVDDSISGTLSGTINTDLLTDASCSDADPNTGNAVYVFAGNNITPDDIDNILPDPYTTTTLEYDTESGEYSYEVGFLPEGKYTVAFTCQSDLDELDSDDAIIFNSVIKNVNVTASEEYEDVFR